MFPRMRDGTHGRTYRLYTVGIQGDSSGIIVVASRKSRAWSFNPTTAQSQIPIIDSSLVLPESTKQRTRVIIATRDHRHWVLIAFGTRLKGVFIISERLRLRDRLQEPGQMSVGRYLVDSPTHLAIDSAKSGFREKQWPRKPREQLA
jgi:hypothetical protein